MTIEQEARGQEAQDLLNRQRDLDAERQAHADFRQRVSDAMKVLQEYITGAVEWRRGEHVTFIELPGGQHVTFSDFILPKPVDPLVEAIREMALIDATPGDAERLRAALAKRGLVVREEG